MSQSALPLVSQGNAEELAAIEARREQALAEARWGQYEPPQRSPRKPTPEYQADADLALELASVAQSELEQPMELPKLIDIMNDEDISKIISISINKAQETARQEVQELLQDTRRRKNKYEVQTAQGSKEMTHQEIADLVKESMRRARETAQAEIAALVADSVRQARESAQIEIREMVQESILRARETAQQEMKDIVKESLQKARRSDASAITWNSSSQFPSDFTLSSFPLRQASLTPTRSALYQSVLSEVCNESGSEEEDPVPEEEQHALLPQKSQEDSIKATEETEDDPEQETKASEDIEADPNAQPSYAEIANTMSPDVFDGIDTESHREHDVGTHQTKRDEMNEAATEETVTEEIASKATLTESQDPVEEEEDMEPSKGDDEKPKATEQNFPAVRVTVRQTQYSAPKDEAPKTMEESGFERFVASQSSFFTQGFPTKLHADGKGSSYFWNVPNVPSCTNSNSVWSGNEAGCVVNQSNVIVGMDADAEKQTMVVSCSNSLAEKPRSSNDKTADRIGGTPTSGGSGSGTSNGSSRQSSRRAESMARIHSYIGTDDASRERKKIERFDRLRRKLQTVTKTGESDDEGTATDTSEKLDPMSPLFDSRRSLRRPTKKQGRKSSADVSQAVVTDELLQQIASKKGSTITPEELAELLQAASPNRVDTELEKSASKLSTRSRESRTSAKSTVTKQEPAFCLNFMDLLAMDDDETVDEKSIRPRRRPVRSGLAAAVFSPASTWIESLAEDMSDALDGNDSIEFDTEGETTFDQEDSVGETSFARTDNEGYSDEYTVDDNSFNAGVFWRNQRQMQGRRNKEESELVVEDITLGHRKSNAKRSSERKASTQNR